MLEKWKLSEELALTQNQDFIRYRFLLHVFNKFQSFTTDKFCMNLLNLLKCFHSYLAKKL
jgi:hypothetical protein